MVLRSTSLRGIATTAVLLAVVVGIGLAQAAGAVGERCPNEASPGFRAYLPDCRAYEIVTPPYKEAMAVGSAGGSLSLDGSSLVVRDLGSFAETKSQGYFEAVYRLNRTPAGWKSVPIEAPVIATYPRFEEEAAGGVGGDLSRSLWVPKEPDRAEEEIYLRGEGGVLPVVVGPGGPPGGPEPRLEFVGGSADLSHLVFRDRAPVSTEVGAAYLWPGDETVDGGGQYSLYEYVGTGNAEPQLVGVSNKGRVARIGESHLISQCGVELGSEHAEQHSSVYNAVSKDGSTVFFTALGQDTASSRLAGSACESSTVVEPPVNEVYARIDNGQEDAHTVAISEPSSEDCSECKVISGKMDAQFQGASRDGSKVFFTTAQSLLPDAEGEGEYLYEYNFDAPAEHKVRLVSAGDALGPLVQGVARISEDGSHVYFVAQGELTGSKNVYGVAAERKAENLYVAVAECAGGGTSCSEPSRRLSFIARLSEADKEDWSRRDTRPVQATPDGHFFVFQSTADLTPDEEGRTEAIQVFEYNAETTELVRVSRGADGYNENGNTSVYPAQLTRISYAEIDRPEPQFVAVSKNGSYVFFKSFDALTPGALVGHRSVYEYHAGEISLISDGHDLSREGSGLLGADESGENVFFSTNDQLLPEDGDTQNDIYDARVNGGFMALAVPASCSGDCQSAESSPPSLLPPGTSSVLAEPNGAMLGASTSVKPEAKPKKKSKHGASRRKKRKKVGKARHAATHT